MRYPIIGATIWQVKNAGGTDIKETRRTVIYLNGCTIWFSVL
jgi:hypothetical protein